MIQITSWCDRMEQILCRMELKGLEGDFREQGLPACAQPYLEYFYLAKRSQSPLAAYPNAGALER